jgi:hypothetical protein
MKYDYMFDMIHVDIEKELKDVYSWEWVEFRLKQRGRVENDNLVASKPVNVQQFCIYLNSMLISDELKKIANTTQFEIGKRIVINDINKINLEFNNNLFSYNQEFKNNDIAGIEKVQDFPRFVNEKTNNKVALIHFNLEEDRNMDSWFNLELSDSAVKLLSSRKEKFEVWHNYDEWCILSSGLTRLHYGEDIWPKPDNYTPYTFRLMQVKEK